MCMLAACTSEELQETESAVVDPNVFVLPQLSEVQRAQIIDAYPQLDPTGMVPRALLEDAIVYFDVNKAHIPKHAYMVVIDLSRFSGMDRFWLVDLVGGTVENHKVAHGDGSDPDDDGLAQKFSNIDGSHMSSLGFYLTAEIYDGTHPHSMRIDGLSRDGSPNEMADTNVRDRLIVVHEASYVDDTSAAKQGRSNGCFALDPSIERSVVDRIHDGTLMYASIKPLAPAVAPHSCGNDLCETSEDETSCAADCAPPMDPGDEMPPAEGGCSTGAGAGYLVILALCGLRGRGKKRAACPRAS